MLDWSEDASSGGDVVGNDAANPPGGLVVRRGQALIAIPDEENGEEITRYFAGREAAEAWASEQRLQRTLASIGAWSDLDWEAAIEWFEQRKNEVPPTPPIDDL